VVEDKAIEEDRAEAYRPIFIESKIPELKIILNGLKMGKLIFKDIFRPSMVLDNKKED